MRNSTLTYNSTLPLLYLYFQLYKLLYLQSLSIQLELALQYASKSGHFRLARQISDLKERRATEIEDDNDDDYYHDNHEPAPSSFSSHHYPSSHSVSQSRSQRVDVKDSKYVSKPRRLLLPNNKLIKSNKENCETIETSSHEDTLEEDGDISENANSQDKESEAGIDEDNNEFNDTIENEPSIASNSQVYSPQVNRQNPVNPFKVLQLKSV